MEKPSFTSTRNPSEVVEDFKISVEDYVRFKTEIGALQITRCLEILADTECIYFSDNGPATLIFLDKLYILLSNADERCPFIWISVNVLLNVCSNSALKKIIISKYQFALSLSKMVGYSMTTDNKTKLLTVIKNLTCGIHIEYQSEALQQLIFALAEWIENDKGVILELCLAILVNLCYKNLPAIYVMTRVDMKKILKIGTTLQGPQSRLYMCKLLIILDCINSEIIDEKLLEELVTLTLNSTITNFKDLRLLEIGQDIELLQLLVQERVTFFRDYQIPEEHILKLVTVIELHSKEESLQRVNTEVDGFCLLLELLKCTLVFRWDRDHKYAFIIFSSLLTVALHNRNPKLCHMCWDILSFLIKQYATNATFTDFLHSNLVELLKHLDVLYSNNYYANLGGLLRFFVAIIDNCNDLKHELQAQLNTDIFNSILPECETQQLSCSKIVLKDVFTICATAVVCKLAHEDVRWSTIKTRIISNRELYHICARVILSEHPDDYNWLRELVFQVSEFFTAILMVDSMKEVHKALNENDLNVMSFDGSRLQESHLSNVSNCLNLVFTQADQVDAIINKLETHLSDGMDEDAMDSLFDFIMQLYECRIASYNFLDQYQQNEIRVATAEWQQLQHEITYCRKRLSLFQIALTDYQKKCGQMRKRCSHLDKTMKNANNELTIQRGRSNVLKSNISVAEQRLAKLLSERNEQEANRNQLNKKKAKCDTQMAKLKQLVDQLEEKQHHLSKVLQKRNEHLTKMQSEVTTLRMEVDEAQKILAQKNSQAANLLEELSAIRRDLADKEKILASIFTIARNIKT